MKVSRNIGASPYQVNPQVLSADRLMQQNSFRIEADNFFKVEPFLHFFEVTNSTLHTIFINDIKQGESIKWNKIPLDIDFGIPPFHRTVATENGGIYIIGGTIVDTFKKSKAIYQYSASSRKLVPVA